MAGTKPTSRSGKLAKSSNSAKPARDSLKPGHASWQAVLSKAIVPGIDLTPGELELRDPDIKSELLQQKLIDLLEQRNEQRKHIFTLARNFSWAAFGLLGLVVLAQIVMRLFFDKSFNVFDGNELQFLVSGVFAQFVGLLFIITRSLYNDQIFKELYERVFSKSHNR